ncbi:DUF3606 domain-containing protein [Variovorax flavidus]|uniref:DUF3606 domain-containing protein n=1 Tax=Variovorax flavidus TaxID=3053501 RepID=UPI00403765A3
MEAQRIRVKVIQALSAAERRQQPDPHDWLKEHAMADDKTKVGGQDRKRINVSEDYEVQDWSRTFGVSEADLRRAVAEVGDNADDVRDFLGKK